MKTQITLIITHAKPIADLADKIAGRAYTLDGVEDVEATDANKAACEVNGQWRGCWRSTCFANQCCAAPATEVTS